MFLARDQHGLAFLRWVRHFLAIFIKVHEFLQNSVFSPRSVRFVVSALGAPMLSGCQQSARVCTKHCFQPKIRTFCQFRTGRILLQRLSAKYTSLYKTEFQARLRHVFSLPHWAHHFLAVFSKVQEFLPNTVSIARTRTFCDFDTFSHCRTGYTTFERFSATCTSLYNVQNSVFCPRSPRFVILILGAPLFSNLQQSTRACTKPKFSPRDQHVLSFLHWAHCFLAIFSKVTGLSKTTFQSEISTVCHFRTGCTTSKSFLLKCTG